ncbi:tRNA (guanosine(46)-N7)-methyltransferase TrmB [Ammoniphilus sp. CFH 90114]|uniref:tRNA (guanosine(46)-N7)-methyltransferase TrmB n=1 Tax=Ammoniphilus sp. CFH 90114 TaxID=2493665 RepID=UPI00100FDB14|nr:tRNA (guanosine(46)-N7)-methyltransferase TrmB [Ammoniphilus sp. CFH 90114]RXT04801.1 tRNA (guanosine(46)-N7)-methyltransferase TrmB [Ammoniphilus sp. CFH 90114]
MRLRKKPWVKDEIVSYGRLVVLDPEKNRGQWKEWFGNDQPIHIELGTGKGNFITTLAEQNPSVNYIGVEVREEVLISAVRKAANKGLTNITFLWFNITKIDEVFAEDEVSRIFLNFSDPWPKSGHAKRRLTHTEFLKRYKKILERGQEIHLKTDNEKLFEFSLNELSNNDFRLKNITLDLHNSKFEEAKSVMTEYEQKFVSRGMKIYRLEAVYQ